MRHVLNACQVVQNVFTTRCWAMYQWRNVEFPLKNSTEMNRLLSLAEMDMLHISIGLTTCQGLPIWPPASHITLPRALTCMAHTYTHIVRWWINSRGVVRRLQALQGADPRLRGHPIAAHSCSPADTTPCRYFLNKVTLSEQQAIKKFK